MSGVRCRFDAALPGWRLTGVKTWISNAPDADHYTVFARTGAKSITAFAVAGRSEGLRGEQLDMLAPHPIGRLEFDGVPARLVGEVGDAHNPELIVRDLDLDLLATVRDRWQFYRDRRPDAYKELVQP